MSRASDWAILRGAFLGPDGLHYGGVAPAKGQAFVRSLARFSMPTDSSTREPAA